MKALVFLVATLCSAHAQGQEPRKCDIEVLSKIDTSLGHASQSQVKDFLLTFGPDCESNVEYTEWSNELVFELFDSQTELTFTTLEQHEDQVDMATILETLEDPLLFEKVDIQRLRSKLQRIATEKSLKDRILLALGRAEAKFD